MGAAPVAIIMGSQSDWATMRHAADTLDALGVGLRGADRLGAPDAGPPLRLRQGARGEAGFKVIIAGAGGAAHLPGMAAAMTPLPVFGVPVESKALSGRDSLYSIVQMPAGIPVGTLAIGRAGRDQRRAARGRRAGAFRRGPRPPPRRLPGEADERRCGTAGRRGRRIVSGKPIAPAATLGILGGGQLGRMLALAAAPPRPQGARLRPGRGQPGLRCRRRAHRRGL